MNNDFALYVNGFVGSSKIDHQVIVSAKNLPTSGRSTGSSTWMESDTHIASKDIIELYVAMSRSPLQSVDFDWREKVLKKIMRCFGSVHMEPWFAANYMTGRLTQTRKDFLDDCVRFVMEGKRQHPAQMYLSYIGMSDERGDEITEFSTPIANLVQHSQPRFAFEKSEVRVPDFIASWVSHPNGFRDLLTSAMVMWGDDTIR